MQISSFSQNPYITQTMAINSIQKTTKSAEVSSATETTFTPPNQLSYEDYQSISFKDLDTLYPSATTVDENGYTHITNENGNNELHGQAVLLWRTANGFEDESLGRTLFEQVSKDNLSESDILVNKNIEMIVNMQGSYILSNFDKLSEEEMDYLAKNHNKYDLDNQQLATNKLSSESFFSMIDTSLSDIKDWGNPNRIHISDAYKQDETFIHIDEVMAEFSKLRAEYQQKLLEVPEYKSVEVFA